jgi:hypothetical protein
VQHDITSVDQDITRKRRLMKDMSKKKNITGKPGITGIKVFLLTDSL